MISDDGATARLNNAIQRVALVRDTVAPAS
jgi:hypothetical protein